jgi:hypothetical protein
MNEFLARLLGYGENESIRDVGVSWAAPWAQEAPLMVFTAALVAAAIGFWFYKRGHSDLSKKTRMSPLFGFPLFGFLRGAVLALLVLFLAEPTLELRVAVHPKPWLWLLFDDSQSMAIDDEQPSPTGSTAAAPRKPRVDVVREILTRKKNDNVVAKLGESFRLRAFLFDRPGEVRPLDVADNDGERVDLAKLAKQLTASGQVTALGDAFNDLGERYASQRPAGVVVFSDFNKNAGLPPVEAATRLDVPIYTVGLGPDSALDVAVDLQAPLLMK